MALTPLQRAVCRLLADHRVRSGESYVAGGGALNALLAGTRLSRHVDVFHDTAEAVETAWRDDRALLERDGYRVDVLRERPGHVEAVVSRAGEAVRVEWARDSAYRFFPLVEHEELGLSLHPFDLATNKLLALLGRREVRDWVDLLQCDRVLQPTGYLAWAACGKDPGFSPAAIVDLASRAGRFSAPEVSELAFEGPAPDAAALSRQWHAALSAAREIVAALPPDHAGSCVMSGGSELCRLPPASLGGALAAGSIRFRSGSIRGAFPSIRP